MKKYVFILLIIFTALVFSSSVQAEKPSKSFMKYFKKFQKELVKYNRIDISDTQIPSDYLIIYSLSTNWFEGPIALFTVDTWSLNSLSYDDKENRKIKRIIKKYRLKDIYSITIKSKEDNPFSLFNEDHLFHPIPKVILKDYKIGSKIIMVNILSTNYQSIDFAFKKYKNSYKFFI